ncbi:MAG: hypothetical protein ACWA41_12525 [Putridiphycobacter sp.]
MARKGQTNISIAVNHSIKEKFEEWYQESECNTKGDFLNTLLNDFIDFDRTEFEKQRKKAEILENRQDFIEKNLNVFVEKGHIIINNNKYKVNSHDHALYTILEVVKPKVN